MNNPVSFTLFGHTHAGKSTLAGFLHSQTDPSFRSATFDEIASQLGANYKSDRKYAYLVDTHKAERERRPEKVDRGGTSIALHVVSVSFNQKCVTLFDTPGHIKLSKEAHKGLFYGDIGIFVIDITDILKWQENPQPELFAHLFTWLKFDRHARDLIIVLSQIDKVAFSQASFEKACSLLQIAAGSLTERIIPTSIDFRNDTSHNVIAKSEMTPWFRGPTLMEAMERASNVVQPKLNELVIMPIDKVFSEHEEGVIVRGKLLEGNLSVGQFVEVNPVWINGTLSTIQCKIANIRAVASNEDVSSALRGAFVSVLIRDLRHKGRRVHKADFECPKTACLFANCSAIVGNIIHIEVSSRDLIALHLFETVRLIWLGRTIGASIVFVEHRRDGSKHVFLQIEGPPVAIHLDAFGKPAIKSFVALNQAGHAFRLQLLAVSASATIVLSRLIPDNAAHTLANLGLDFELGKDSLIIKCANPRKFMQHELHNLQQALSLSADLLDHARFQLP